MLSVQVQFSPVAAAVFAAALVTGNDTVTAGLFAAVAHIAADYAKLALRRVTGTSPQAVASAA